MEAANPVYAPIAWKGRAQKKPLVKRLRGIYSIVISNAIAHKAYASTGGTHLPTLTQRPALRNGTAYNNVYE